MARVFGVAIVRLNGVDHRTKQGAVLELGGETKTSQFASGKRTGSSGEPIGSKITVTFEMVADTDVEALRNFEGIAEHVTDVGIAYRAGNSETTEPPKVSDNGGGIELTIEGDPATESS